MHLNAQGSSAPCRVQKSCLCTSALQICGQNYASQRRQSRTPSSNDFSPFSSPSSSPSSFRLTFYTTLSFPTVCLLFTPHILGPSPHSHSVFFFASPRWEPLVESSWLFFVWASSALCQTPHSILCFLEIDSPILFVLAGLSTFFFFLISLLPF